MKQWLTLSVVLVLVACSRQGLIESLADPERVKVARGYVDRLVAGDFTALAAELEPGLRTGREIEQLVAIRALIPEGTPTNIELVGYYVNYTNGATRYSVSHQFSYNKKWIATTMVWSEKPGPAREIYSMMVTPLAMPLQEMYAFSFSRAGFLHYVFFIGAVTIPAFILVTLIVCIRTKLPRRKWLWIIFILVGCVQSSLNWTTGETTTKPFFLQLFGAGAMSGGLYAPWILSISVPIGAIAFWFKRRRILPPPPAGEALRAET